MSEQLGEPGLTKQTQLTIKGAASQVAVQKGGLGAARTYALEYRPSFVGPFATDMALHFTDGAKMVFEGSANLRTNGNIEQFALFNDAGLHDWHAAWIDEKHRAWQSDQT